MYGKIESKSSDSATTSRWYLAKPNELAGQVFAYIRYLNNTQNSEASNFLKYMRMYADMPVLNIGYRVQPLADWSKAPRLTLNITKSIIDTIHSKMSKNQVKPMFLTDGGDYRQQRSAEVLNQYSAGLLYSAKAYKAGTDASMHSLILGTGIVKAYACDGEIVTEPVLADELFVDKHDGMYGEPTQIHQTKLIHRDVLAETFPARKKEIKAATSEPLDERVQFTKDHNPDMLTVVESWKLPAGKNAPGRHSICLESVLLLDEEYKRDRFPFSFIRWRKLPIGFFGQGISEEIKGIQIEINKTLQTIQTSLHLTAIPKLFVDAGSQVSLKSLDNKIGGIIRYTGTAPIPGKLGTFPSELFNHLEWLYNKAWEIVGASQLSGASVKPAGLDSGKALRTYNDIESERFLAYGKEYERFMLDLTDLMLVLAQEEAEAGRPIDVLSTSNESATKVSWTQLNYDRDSYVMQAFPVSALSAAPEARMAEVNDMINMGFIDREQAMDLLDFPDIRALKNMELSVKEDTDRVIDLIVDKGEYEGPEPFQNLQASVKRMQSAYLYYKTKKLEEDKLELLRTWITTATTMIQEATVATAPPAEAAPVVDETMLPPDTGEGLV